MIKSAHLTGSVSRKAGGLFDAVSRLAQSQLKQGMAVKVFGLWDESTDADLTAWNPVPVAAFKPSWPGLIGRSPKFLEELNDFAPDISHTHGLWLYPGIAARNYSRGKKRPYLISPHGMLDPWAMKNSRWKKQIAWCLFERENLRGARCLRALCESEAQSIRQLGLKNDIAVIPNGIDLPEIGSQEMGDGRWKMEDGSQEPGASRQSNAPWQGVVESGRKVLLYLGRIHPKKGLVNLLRAWAKNRKSDIVNRKSEDWLLAIAGWDQGGHEQELKQLATELGLAWKDGSGEKAEIGKAESRKQKVEIGNLQAPNSNLKSSISNLPSPISLLFLGPQFNAAKAACYRHCDAFVLPSFSEGLPMVVLEAWANSKPVVMTPECNLPEGFQAGAALKVETTEAGLVAGLNELQRMADAERMAMGSRGHDLVVERFTWSRVAGQLLAVQEWILGGGPKPGCVWE